MGRRAGFTLIETLIAMVIVSLLSLMAYPRVAGAVAKSDLRGARTRVVNMLAAARAAAVQGGRSTSLKFAGDNVWVEATTGGVVDTLGSVWDLGGTYGTTVEVAEGVTSIDFNPRGIASGFNTGGTVISLTRGSYVETVTVDALGRVQK